MTSAKSLLRHSLDLGIKTPRRDEPSRVSIFSRYGLILLFRTESHAIQDRMSQSRDGGRRVEGTYFSGTHCVVSRDYGS